MGLWRTFLYSPSQKMPGFDPVKITVRAGGDAESEHGHLYRRTYNNKKLNIFSYYPGKQFIWFQVDSIGRILYDLTGSPFTKQLEEQYRLLHVSEITSDGK